MTTIDYSGIDPDSIELINSTEFREVLAAYPNLRLVTVAEDDDNEIFNDLSLPLPESGYDCVAVMDRNDEDAFMWVLYDNHESVTDPSPAFIEILRVMDAFSRKTLDQSLFLPKNMEFYQDSPEVLAADYDFTNGDYIL